LEETWITEVMAKDRGSERSGLDIGDAPHGRSNTPMDMTKEMAMAVTSIATWTAGEDPLEPIKRNKNWQQTWCSEIPAAAWALWDWKSRKHRVLQHQARKLAQLHRTIGKIANMLGTHTALQPAQLRRMEW
jgi:hypothetical protein